MPSIFIIELHKPVDMMQDTLKLLIQEGILDCKGRGVKKSSHAKDDQKGDEGDEAVTLAEEEDGDPGINHHRLEWEISVSMAILGAGLGIDCLMIRYGPIGFDKVITSPYVLSVELLE